MPGEPRPELRLALSVEDELSGFDTLAEFKDWEVVTELSVELHVANRNQVASQLLHWLATPHTSASGATGIPFPRLRRVDTESLEYAGGQAIVDMIKTRFSTPGVNPPENVITRSSGGERSFEWPDLDEIRGLFWLESICFV
ncbi:hypothetical protein M407DRAFT_242569 [Tulasnella calospora MUT 4182]|uniref:Uncharacterized protein n=1 Tax=Tulasnella calospora MUT 4182 TaxID=1051891 RepID=A0A0C3L6V7_9AGAM|nr:hypothetical protein M407DRAFT_242569 [Tulasnella calospora MUT 4182]